MFCQRDQQLIEAGAGFAGTGIAGDKPVSAKLFDVPFPRSDLTYDLV